jgi:8-oxo-dGTP pyrophosphatase MutT (NUDIX family)
MNSLIALLKAELQKTLHGTDVQWEMASSDRMMKDFPRVPGDDARIAAVLILLYPFNRSVYTVLMQRHNYNGVHGGQISLPGGKKEPFDENVIQTALREANEETGVDPERISVIGTLTPLFIPVSNTMVTPVVAWTDEIPVFNPQPEEVEFLINADINRFTDPLCVMTKPMKIRGEEYLVKYFDYDGYVIWGATAMILHEFLSIIKGADIRLTFNQPESIS